MIAALALGCFAGAVSAEKSNNDITLNIGIAGVDFYNLITINSAFVSNDTTLNNHYLYFNVNNEYYIADKTNISKHYHDYLVGFSFEDTEYYKFESSEVFNISGLLNYLDNNGNYGDLIFLNSSTEWNYTNNDDLGFYLSLYPNTTSILFDANGGSFPDLTADDGNPSGIAWTKSNYIEAEVYDEPIRDGYKFAGWTVIKDGNDVIAFDGYNPDGAILSLYASSHTESPYFNIIDGRWIALENRDYTNPVTLYAKWEKIEESSGSSSAIILIGSKSSGGNGPHIEHKYVTFDANGGNGEMAKQQFTGGQTKALSLNQFTREGFNFAGWALEPTGMVTFTDGEEIMVDEDITIYAVWVEPVPDTPDVPADDGETGIPIWAAVLGGVVILAVIIGLIVYFFVIRRGGA